MVAMLSSDIVYHEHLLYFNQIPDKLLSDNEAKKIATEIIQIEPQNKIALGFLN